jgi:hypothetical protein
MGYKKRTLDQAAGHNNANTNATSNKHSSYGTKQSIQKKPRFNTKQNKPS